MLKYKQLKDNTDTKQALLTQYHNAIVDAINKDEAMILLSGVNTNHISIVNNVSPKSSIPKALEDVSKSLRKQ